MIKLKTLQLVFENELKFSEIPLFRGAVSRKVGFEHDWYHNHNMKGKEILASETEYNGFSTAKLHYRYPLIQYKIIKKDSKNYPAILFIGQCVRESVHFTTLSNWDIEIKDRLVSFKIKDIINQETELNILPSPKTYRLNHWRALNEVNYKNYQETRSIVDKYSQLEKILENQIVGVSRSLGFEPMGKIEVCLKEVFHEKWGKVKGNKYLYFNIEFESNLLLPETIGIGKNSSIGMGVLKYIK